MSRLKRFQHLEKPRSERPGEDGTSKTEERFSRMTSGHAPAASPPPPSMGRIRTQVSEPSLALDARDREEQQFIRCMHCEADNSRFAQVCVHCGAPLLTEEQRAFNEAFHQRRRAEVSEQAEAEARFRERRDQATEAQRRENAALQAQAYEMMKQEAGAGPEDWDVPWGVRLLRSIKNPTWQWVAIGGFVLVGGLCLMGLWASWSSWWSSASWSEGAPRYSRYGRYPSLRTIVSFVGLIALVGAFIPPSWRHRFRRRSWWETW